MMDIKKVLKAILHVYTIFCTCMFSILIIAALIVWINFGKITAYATEQVVDNYNAEITTAVSDYIEASDAGKSFKLDSIETLKGGGIQTSFVVANNAASGFDVSAYQNKTTEELIAEFGLSINDIPKELKPLLSMTKQTFVLDFKDAKGNPVLKREITAKEIAKLTKKR